ncbi:putative ribosomal protein S7 [Rosellinia necatrix]|uniref:Small ribosomal subunit protein uS7m n=1 Tax=Rosellinia necatrix TaxID=77044 RepID=A0A1W2TVD4_ROSNE|nr:putative ribosomal protein S7 [Rosellinia necatrix]
MASKINPWRTLPSLAVRTRPSRPNHSPISHIPAAMMTTTTATTTTTTTMPTTVMTTAAAAARASVLLGRRGFADDAPSKPEETKPYVPRPPEPFADNFMNADALAALERAAAGLDALELVAQGLKYGMPTPPTKNERLQDRHHPVVHQVTRMLMRDGKLSKAQKHLSLILNYLRTTPPPKVSPLRPLLPGSPPPSQLPLNPLLYLTLAIDSVAPIVRVRSMKGLAGGGNALDVPEPISARSRRRQAIIWILDIVNKKRSTGSGRKQFAARFGQEIVAVVEGRSAAWDRRQVVHKLGTAARANLAHPNVAGKR